MTPRPPRHLSPPNRKWWSAVVQEYGLEETDQRLLTLAAGAWERAQGAREALAAQGTTYTDRFGAPRTRPEVAIERDSRLAFARLLRDLALDTMPAA